MASKSYKMRATVIVPTAVAKLKSQTLAPGETEKLPQEYGDHLVSERLADPASAAAKRGRGGDTDKQREALETEVAEAEAAVDAADGDLDKAAAETRLDEAKKALAAL